MIKILILFTTILIGQADHIIFTEVVLTPSDGEYVRISNPTDEAIDLSNYYLTDATDASFNKYYYNLPTGENFSSSSGFSTEPPKRPAKFFSKNPAHRLPMFTNLPTKSALTLKV